MQNEHSQSGVAYRPVFGFDAGAFFDFDTLVTVVLRDFFAGAGVLGGLEVEADLEATRERVALFGTAAGVRSEAGLRGLAEDSVAPAEVGVTRVGAASFGTSAETVESFVRVTSAIPESS